MTPLFVQEKYILSLGTQLERFKQVRDGLFTFRCPICGDSKKNKYKTRAYFYVFKNAYCMKCHNCNASMGFEYFMKQRNPALYKQYKMDGFVNRSLLSQAIATTPTPVVEASWLASLPLAIDNKDAFEYLKRRQIPEHRLSDILYCEDLNIIKQHFTRYDEVEFAEEPRIVLPVFSLSNVLLGIIARAIFPSKLRYVNLKTESTEPFIYNINNVDLNKRVFVFEGAIDSLFISNSVAVDGSAFNKATRYVDRQKDILVFDNQPKNRELLKAMEPLVSDGYTICIWPDNIKQKDINDMICKGGMTIQQVENIIVSNAKQGLECQLEFAKWRKR